MSELLEEAAPTSEAGFKDRKAGLVFFGMLQITVGGIVGLLALFQTLMITGAGSIMEEAGAPSVTGLVWFAMGFLLPAAAAFIALGVGSIMARRWARALSLVVGWIWLVYGIVGLAGLFLSLPTVTEAMREASAGTALSQGRAATLGTAVMVGMEWTRSTQYS